MSENQIIEGCLSGDRQCQRLLYDAYKVDMFRVCLRFADCRAIAEDMLQEGFIRVFTDLHQYAGKGALGGWIRRVIVNTALMHIRKNKKWQQMSPLEVMPDNQFANEKVFSHLEAEALTKLIGQLPTGYRIVFNLFVIEGYSHQEIADQLNITVNTSKSQLSKAKANLRKKLEAVMFS